MVPTIRSRQIKSETPRHNLVENNEPWSHSEEKKLMKQICRQSPNLNSENYSHTVQQIQWCMINIANRTPEQCKQHLNKIISQQKKTRTFPEMLLELLRNRHGVEVENLRVSTQGSDTPIRHAFMSSRLTNKEPQSSKIKSPVKKEPDVFTVTDYNGSDEVEDSKVSTPRNDTPIMHPSNKSSNKKRPGRPIKQSPAKKRPDAFTITDYNDSSDDE